MGVFDNITSSVNKGIVGANRATATMKLKAQISDTLKRRQSLAAQLGASLYDATKDNAEFRTGREALYDGIAECDAERMAYQEEIDRIEREAQATAAAAICPFCGSRMGESDMFCAGCGKSMAEIRTVLEANQPQQANLETGSGAVCPSCGFSVSEEDVFCMKCGSRLR